jgi:hypothetical protein
MQLTSTIEEPLSLLRIRVRRRGDGPFDAQAAYASLLSTVARSGMQRLLLDYSDMTTDLSIEEFLELRGRRRLIGALRSVKTAVILRDELETTMMLLASMRTFGVRVAAFSDEKRALEWLLRQ